MILRVELTDEQAQNLSLFLKRVAFSTFMDLSETEEQAYGMRSAVSELNSALALNGYDPR
jgi:hypothetical protein